MLVVDQLEKQRGMCAICRSPLSEHYAVLDRFDRTGNFLPTNVRALHADCEALVLRRRAAGRLARGMLQAAE